MLGPVDIEVDGRRAPPELLWKKNQGLLVYLARSPGFTRTREHLTGVLWPESSEQSAKHSLREAIRILRRTLGDALETDGSHVRLSSGAVRADLDEFEELSRSESWSEAAELVRGEFLEGLAVPGASAFEDWLTAERARWSRRSAEAMVSWANELSSHGRMTEAVDVASQALRLEPTMDSAVRVVMRSRALAGDRTAALAAYQDLLERQRELGATPDRRTEDLAERIGAGRVWHLSDEVKDLADRGGESRRAPLAGREEKLNALLQVWNRCRREGRAVVAVVRGNPGTGRTRMLEEISARAELDGATVASVRAVEGDVRQDLSGILAVARGLLNAPGAAGADPAAIKALSEALPEWAEHFGAGQSRKKLPLARALFEVVRISSEERPVLLAVDDAHWLDRETLLALGGLCRDLPQSKLMLLLTASDTQLRDEIEDLCARVGRDLEGTVVTLDLLSESDIAELARWAMPSYEEEQVERLRRRLMADSAGLPLLVVEVLHAVALGMELQGEGPDWPEPFRTLDQTLPGRLPDPVRSAVRVGFRRLSQDAQNILAAGSVIGDRFAAEELARVTGWEEGRLIAALDELEWQRWIVAEPRGYSYVARIVRVLVAEDMVTPGQRKRIEESLSG